MSSAELFARLTQVLGAEQLTRLLPTHTLSAAEETRARREAAEHATRKGFPRSKRKSCSLWPRTRRAGTSTIAGEEVLGGHEPIHAKGAQVGGVLQPWLGMQ